MRQAIAWLCVGLGLGTVVRGVLRGGLHGLLAAKPEGAGMTPERVQLLVVTVVVGGRYLAEVLAVRGSSVPALGSMWVWIFALSCAVYAAGKAARMSHEVSVRKVTEESQ